VTQDNVTATECRK